MVKSAEWMKAPSERPRQLMIPLFVEIITGVAALRGLFLGAFIALVFLVWTLRNG